MRHFFTFYEVVRYPAYLRNLTALAIFFLMLLLGYIFYFHGQWEAIKKLQNKQTILKESIILKKEQHKNLAIYQQKLNKINQQLATPSSQLISSAMIPALMETIFILGGQSGISIEDLNRLPEIDKKFYAELPVQMVLSGSYYNLTRFIGSLVALEEIISVVNFSLEPRLNSDNLTMNLMIHIYCITHQYFPAQVTAPIRKLPIIGLPTFSTEHSPFQLREAVTNMKMIGSVTVNQQRWGLIGSSNGRVMRVKEGQYLMANGPKVVDITENKIILEILQGQTLQQTELSLVDDML